MMRVLQLRPMGHPLTIRLTEELLAWLKERSRQTGVPVGRLIRQQLEAARSARGKQRFLRHAGAISGLYVRTCEAVLAEAAFHLEIERLRAVSEWKMSALRVALAVPVAGDWLGADTDPKSDRCPSLCLIRVSELYPRHTVITVDSADFRVYRRNKRETIPLLCPPMAN